jgi:hypothetical protein
VRRSYTELYREIMFALPRVLHPKLTEGSGLNLVSTVHIKPKYETTSYTTCLIIIVMLLVF